MELTRRNLFVYVLVAAVWALVVTWQVQEHHRVQEYAKANLRNRSKDYADMMGCIIRGMQFRRAVFSTSLQPVLERLVGQAGTELDRSGDVQSIVLLNATGAVVAKAGSPIDLQQQDLLKEKGERWGSHSLLIAYPVVGTVNQEGQTNPATAAPFLVDPPTNSSRGRFPRRPPELRPEAGASNTVDQASVDAPPPPGPPDGDRDRRPPPDGERDHRPPREGGFRPPRPWWMRGVTDPEFEVMSQKREVHGLVLAMSTNTFDQVCRQDLWLRFVITFFATIAAIGSGFAWRNLAKSSELQIRLIRASELNTHLKEMNLAAAGLAHETRNPLNIIRGRAQMISKLPGVPSEIQHRTREITDEADKVAAQLNEFINYSRPREVRRTRLALGAIVNEVVRALGYDLEEKKIRLEVIGEQVAIEADEQLLRQALFNLLLNAAQAVEPGGEIQVFAARHNAAEAVLEIRDNGPGVPPERRTEIFKPYFTTQKTGTGLGLAIVQQIVLAHGWEIECLANQPKGAIFRISHLKLAV